MRLPSICFIALAVSLCCSRAQEQKVPNAAIEAAIAAITDFGKGPAGTSVITIDGVRIEIDKRVKPLLKLSLVTEGQSSVTTSTQVQINGQDLRILKGELKIGTRSYGAVSSETAIEIKPEGVLIDGRNRGALPDAARK